MNIRDTKLDVSRMAHDIAFLYTQKHSQSSEAPNLEEIDNLVQAYVTAYSRVAAMDSEALEALVR